MDLYTFRVTARGGQEEGRTGSCVCIDLRQPSEFKKSDKDSGGSKRKQKGVLRWVTTPLVIDIPSHKETEDGGESSDSKKKKRKKKKKKKKKKREQVDEASTTTEDTDTTETSKKPGSYFPLGKNKVVRSLLEGPVTSRELCLTILILIAIIIIIALFIILLLVYVLDNQEKFVAVLARGEEKIGTHYFENTFLSGRSLETENLPEMDGRQQVIKRLKDDPKERVKQILSRVPLIDGHNDLPWQIRHSVQNSIYNDAVNLQKDQSGKEQFIGMNVNFSHTDIPRLRKGMVGGLALVSFIECTYQFRGALRANLQLIDMIKELVRYYNKDFGFVTKSEHFMEYFEQKKIGAFIGVEGGHMMGEDLGVLRFLYHAGARYMTLTWNCDTPWSQWHSANPDDHKVFNIYGLTKWGERVIQEMNRLGMMIDLSHVHPNTMRKAMLLSKAPVIFSHSSAFTLCTVSRNVPDHILTLVKNTSSIVMVNFYSKFVNCNFTRRANIQDVVDHINHIRKEIGVDHVGIGSDYGGVDDLPDGLEDTSKFPDLFEALIKSEVDWSDEDLEKLAGKNFLRVFKKVEEVSDPLEPGDGTWIPEKDFVNVPCTYQDRPGPSGLRKRKTLRYF